MASGRVRQEKAKARKAAPAGRAKKKNDRNGTV